MESKIEAFIKQIIIWKRKVENDPLEIFPFAKEFLADNDLESDINKSIIINHLSSLLKNWQKYVFPELVDRPIKFDWIQNRFELQEQGVKASL